MVEELKRDREDSPVPEVPEVPEKKAKVEGKATPENTEKEEVKDELKKNELKSELKKDEVKDEEKSEENTKDEDKKKPKFVFGATSAFKTGFGVAEKKDEKDEKKKDEKPAFTFGSGLSFGSGFNVLNTEKKKEEEKKIEDDKSKLIPDSELAKEEHDTRDSNSATQPAIKLQKQDVKSGEESEECLYQVNAKLFQLVDIKSGWKERGVGAVKINRDKESSKTRVVMRSRGILKVILNLPLVKGFSVKKGFPGSLQSEKYVRIVALDENNEPTQYALRTGKEDTAEELYQKIIDSIPK